MEFIKISPIDNVVVALENGEKGEKLTVDGQEITLLQDITFGHKIAIKNIAIDENIIKYASPIGHATKAIEIGEHVHIQNVKTNLDATLEYTYEPELAAPEVNVLDELKNNGQNIEVLPQTFWGYQRKNGEVGIRNDCYIVPTVGCVNHTAEKVRERFIRENPLAEEVFDNIIVLRHPYGCSQMGDDHVSTRQFLANAVLHPNAAAVLVLGLGCENNSINVFKQVIEEGEIAIEHEQLSRTLLDKADSNRIKFLIAQEVEDEVISGVEMLHSLLEVVKEEKRVELPLSKLRIGLKCGGSDGLSGITANQLLGKFSDFLVQAGGSAVLTEVPEMFGAETILMNRCIDLKRFEQTVSLINNFKQYFLDHNMVVYENPSPGNKAGGITTLEDKSLGCTQKAGSTSVMDVLQYGERIKKHGLTLLQAPGNDLVASSALASAGCHLVLFTTGRGNPFGTFVPTVKVSSNDTLAEHKSKWIDFNAGKIIHAGMPEVAYDFIQKVIEIANGTLTCAEKNGYQEIAIFKTGVTL
ncbi:altronate hydrolase [Pilibacter termitis]|uniref:Altronate hydrolase n=1 Tax=Pilibacter termitis TaxID=263852 RepID=A0A1T4KRJ3_9ENTE|nr:altronate dehydratase family protein [Pilibacter termitis]SJZ44958.1 altronate hydrolase [Pilibacter termitis]